MHQTGLIYKGKKKPFQYDNPKTGKLKFTPGVVTWVPAKTAEFLMSVNPSMFTKTGERGHSTSDDDAGIEDAADIIKNKALRDAEVDPFEVPVDFKDDPIVEGPKTDEFFLCPKCDRKYKDEEWYKKHIEKCEG